MLNSISIMGRLSSDPQLRRTASGKAVASFSVACERDFKNQQTGEKEVDFIECVAWGGTAEMVEKYFHKGQMAVATGRLQLRDWTDKNGQKRRQAEILVNSISISAEARKAALRPALGLTTDTARRRIRLPPLRRTSRSWMERTNNCRSRPGKAIFPLKD